MLSADLRMALGGLASADPPPWLHRMRELGYPPGYMYAHAYLQIQSNNFPSHRHMHCEQK